MGRKKVSYLDIAHEEASREDKDREKVLKMAEAAIQEIKETALVELDKSGVGAVVYLIATSGYLRLTNNIEGTVLVVGHNKAEFFLETAKKIVEKLIQEYPDKKFEVGSW